MHSILKQHLAITKPSYSSLGYMATPILIYQRGQSKAGGPYYSISFDVMGIFVQQ